MSAEAVQLPTLPVYFDRLLESFQDGRMGRHAHLGHWDGDGPPPLLTPDDDSLQDAQLRLNLRLIQLAGLHSGQRVLDVGCGFGGLLQQIDESFSDMDLTGVNLDPRQLDICHRLRSVSDNSLRWQEADACQLPFANSHFDVLFCVEAMFHFASRQQFLDEVWRVLKPGGWFVASDIVLTNSAGSPAVPLFCVEALLQDGYGPWPDPWCEAGTATDLLSQPRWTSLTVIDATRNTLPSYDYIVSQRLSEQRDPGDVAARAALMLRWLHRSGGLRYEYLAAAKSAQG